MVSLDDILAEAGLTKGAMYFHFASKQALALAIIDDLAEMSRAPVAELLTRRMSGTRNTDRPCLSPSRSKHPKRSWSEPAPDCSKPWTIQPTYPPQCRQSSIETVTTLIQKAVTEGDVVDHIESEDIAKMLVALRWVRAESAISTNPSATSITCKKHGSWHYPASPIRPNRLLHPIPSNDATHSP